VHSIRFLSKDRSFELLLPSVLDKEVAQLSGMHADEEGQLDEDREPEVFRAEDEAVLVGVGLHAGVDETVFTGVYCGTIQVCRCVVVAGAAAGVLEF